MHDVAWIERDGLGWSLTCSCGWVTTGHGTPNLALSMHYYHREQHP